MVVIGAGPAGEVCAGSLAREGLDVALVERELVGGECAYWACMPSKALLRPGQLLAEVRRVPGAREGLGTGLDAAATLRRRDDVIHELDDTGQLPWVRERGIRLVRGRARLEGERRVRVGEELLGARRAVIIAVGSGARLPPVDGLAELAPWTNRQATTAAAVPQSLIVLGGGAVGCELAQAWASLGAGVTLVEAQPSLLPGEEPFAGEQLQRALSSQGLSVRTGAQVTAARRDPDGGEVTLTLSDGARVTGAELLVAVGRRPHTDDLGLETVGLEAGEPIAVDDRMQVSGIEWLYAVGDVNGRALFTHAAKYQALAAVATIMNRPARAGSDGERSPRVVFTDPQVAAVGHTFQRALAAGLPARALDADIGAVPGASFVGKGTPATARIVIDERREVIVGATFTGPEVAEMLHAATVAIIGEVPLRRLVDAMPAFPTRSEVWLRLLHAWAP